MQSQAITQAISDTKSRGAALIKEKHMATKAAKQTASANTIARLNELSAQRETWERDLFARSNKALYELLMECLKVFLSIKGTGAESVVLADMKTVLAANGIVTKGTSPVLTVIVRYVFKNDRRRAHSYSRVLRIAVLEGVEPARFADWVAEQGGIEEVVRTKALSEETLKKRATLNDYAVQAKQLLLEQLSAPLATVAKTGLMGNAVDTGEYTLLIGKTQANGETKVLSVVPSATESMIKAAVQHIAQALMNGVTQLNAANAKVSAEQAAMDAANCATVKQAA
jgi:hypothetical protein